MSEFPPETLQKWRDQGSLRYLAHHLRVTTKQVARYWDNGWIAGSFRTAKGHRRIRYNDNTVKHVQLMVEAVKGTNIAIRYHVREIDYCGTKIPVKGCTRMEDVYRRARKAGLNEQDARNAGYQPQGIRAKTSASNLESELLYAIKGTSEKEVRDQMSIVSRIPARSLYEARNPAEFRARARAVWRDILCELRLRRRANGAFGSSPMGDDSWAQKVRRILRPILLQPDRDSFIAAFNKASELEARILDYDERTYRKLQETIHARPEIMALKNAALSLKQSEQAPSAAALARAMGISRPALYRAYGKNEIQDALKPLRNDPKAIHATRKERKKSNPLAGKREHEE